MEIDQPMLVEVMLTPASVRALVSVAEVRVTFKMSVDRANNQTLGEMPSVVSEPTGERLLALKLLRPIT